MNTNSIDILLQPIHAFLGCTTPRAWLAAASQPQNMALIIQDHANCEKKAASTAINLMFRYGFYNDLQIKLSQLVREEMLHYEQVLDVMAKRGQAWVAIPAGRYAGALRKEIKTYEPQALVDVLIVGAFVEARSCERFAALAPYVDDELAKFYKYLLKSESRHFEDYLTLAQSVSEQDISKRVETFRQLEADLIITPDPQLRFHSGIPA
ncbi:MAG: tRNA-(ms[2]io[6]A)-hydroxylase [Moraxellaceae bacterium]|nr:MAG: tRNA-(ms[2]io[6]A)-hydroxylase [Moraxellaceae bacterium]